MPVEMASSRLRQTFEVVAQRHRGETLITYLNISWNGGAVIAENEETPSPKPRRFRKVNVYDIDAIENDPSFAFDRRRAIPKMDPITGALKYIIEERPPEPPKMEPVPEPEPEPFVPLVELEPPEPKEEILEAIKLREGDWKSLPEESLEPIPETEPEQPLDQDLTVKIEEEEHALLTHEGVIEEYKANGTLHIQNDSSRDRVWDVDLLLQAIEQTTLDQAKFHVTEIEAQSEKKQRYGVATNRPVLDIQEQVTSFGKIGKNQTLIMKTPTEVTFHITVRNASPETLDTVTVNKIVPEAFQDVFAIKASEGETEYTGEQLVWTIDALEGDQTASLIFKTTIDAQSPEPIRSGTITADYEMRAPISALKIARFGAFARNLYYIEVDESDQPGLWVCRLIFNNRSDFPVDLLVVEVSDPDTNEKFLDIKNEKDYIVPGGAWVSKEWKIKKSQRPAFIQRCDFTVIPGLEFITRGHLSMGDTEMPVAALEAEQSLDAPSVPSYVRTPEELTIKVTNIGSAPLNAVDLRTTLPATIIPPDRSSITASVMGKRMSRESLEIGLDPDEREIPQPHELRLKVRNLKDTLGLLERGESIKFNYPVIVDNPAPKQIFEFPTTISGQSYPPGPYIKALSTGEMLKITVAHTPRRFTIGKAVEPFGAAGHYAITITFKNRGDAVLKEVLLQDQVPENFERSDFSIKPHVVQLEGRHLLQWYFELVEPDENFEIEYEIHGKGAYRPKSAQVFYDVGELHEPTALESDEMQRTPTAAEHERGGTEREPRVLIDPREHQGRPWRKATPPAPPEDESLPPPPPEDEPRRPRATSNTTPSPRGRRSEDVVRSRATSGPEMLRRRKKE